MRILKAGVIDYGVGNIFSICNALDKVGFKTKLISNLPMDADSNVIVLPGVGGFKIGAKNLQLFKPNILNLVEEGTLIFGVCLGMQLFFESSEEGPGSGLGLLKGEVLKFPRNVKTPHMGWNSLKKNRDTRILNGIGDGQYFYFVHSYYPMPLDTHIIAAETEYGLSFASVVAVKNIYGTQFHPEKSGKVGEQVLKNLFDLVKK